METLNRINTLIIVLAVCISIMFVVHKCTKERVVYLINDVVVVDSVAVQTLNTEITALKNKLNAKPTVLYKTITLTDTVATTKTVVVIDTVLVYPVGSENMKRDYPFYVPHNDGDLSLTVKTDLYAYVYADANNTMYYADSLRVWLADVRIKQVAPTPKSNKSLNFMGGVNVETRDKYTISPHIGLGYIHGTIGGYSIYNGNTVSAGISINLLNALRK